MRRDKKGAPECDTCQLRRHFSHVKVRKAQAQLLKMNNGFSVLRLCTLAHCHDLTSFVFSKNLCFSYNSQIAAVNKTTKLFYSFNFSSINNDSH